MKRNLVAEPQWMGWLREQVRHVRDFDLMNEALKKQGLSEEEIAAGFQAVRPLHSALIDGKVGTPPLIRRAPPKLRKIDVPFELYAYDDFLSQKECARIVALTSHHLKPSPIASDLEDKQYRTSTTCALADLRSPLALEVDAKICRTIGIRAQYGEGIQAQRYDIGQQFKPHCDFFHPGTPDFRRFATINGNRTWTVMIYLNEGMEGGATRFTKADLAFAPKAGMALLWNSLLEDGTPNHNTEHCGEPVTRGHKVIITKWFRLFGTGPVFYDT